VTIELGAAELIALAFYVSVLMAVVAVVGE
jgi:hypothetical protein